MTGVFGLLAAAMLAAHAPHVVRETGPADLSRAVLDEINFARTRPQAYVRVLESYRERFDGYLCRDADGYGPGRLTHEGVSAVDEAIAAVKRQKPLPALRELPALVQAAASHAGDQGSIGGFGHRGTNGSTLGERLARYGVMPGMSAEVVSYGEDTAEGVVRQLIVDDGLRSRGHRADVFDPTLAVAGVACGPHAQWGAMCVVDLASRPVARAAED